MVFHFLKLSGRHRLSQSWRSVARQRPVERSRRQLPTGPALGAGRPGHFDQLESTPPTLGLQSAKQRTTGRQKREQRQ